MRLTHCIRLQGCSIKRVAEVFRGGERKGYLLDKLLNSCSY